MVRASNKKNISFANTSKNKSWDCNSVVHARWQCCVCTLCCLNAYCKQHAAPWLHEQWPATIPCSLWGVEEGTVRIFYPSYNITTVLFLQQECSRVSSVQRIVQHKPSWYSASHCARPDQQWMTQWLPQYRTHSTQPLTHIFSLSFSLLLLAEGLTAFLYKFSWQSFQAVRTY